MTRQPHAGMQHGRSVPADGTHVQERAVMRHDGSAVGEGEGPDKAAWR